MEGVSVDFVSSVAITHHDGCYCYCVSSAHSTNLQLSDGGRRKNTGWWMLACGVEVPDRSEMCVDGPSIEYAANAMSRSE